MSEFEKIVPELSKLFLRIDAAAPTDPVLQAAAKTWRESREGALFPGISLLKEMPKFALAHVFLARIMFNGQREWVFSDAGASARVSLGAQSGRLKDVADPALTQRLEALFNLVAQKEEPCSGMFELQEHSGRPMLYEVYAAPLTPPQDGETALLAVINWRSEATR